jgi:hypothetical protein
MPASAGQYLLETVEELEFFCLADTWGSFVRAGRVHRRIISMSREKRFEAPPLRLVAAKLHASRGPRKQRNSPAPAFDQINKSSTSAKL